MKPDAKAVAMDYMKAFEEKNRDAAAAYLHAKGLFKGPLSEFQNADTFVKEMCNFMYIAKSVQIKKVLADETDVCVLWDYETVIPSIPVTPIVTWFKIEDGKIREFHVNFNPVPFIAAMQNGEIEKALRTAQRG